MKKVITSLLMAAMFSVNAFAQTGKSNTDLLKSSFNNLTQAADDFDDDYEPLNKVKDVLKTPNAEKMFLKQDNVPDNIKQDYKEEKDGYLLEGFQLGVGIGVLGGVNAQLGYRIPRREYNFWKNRFGFRIDYNSWKPLKNTIETYLEDHPIKLDDNEFTGMISGTNYGALIDFYPFGNTWFLGNFRLSAGYYTGDFAIDTYMTKSGISEEFEMSGINYKIDGQATLNAAVDADVKGPYAGLGFDFQILYGLKLFFDAGVVFIDNPRVRTDINGIANLYVDYGSGYVNVGSVTAKDNDDIKRLLSDMKSEYEDELKIITSQNIFPMIKLGLMLRF